MARWRSGEADEGGVDYVDQPPDSERRRRRQKALLDSARLGAAALAAGEKIKGLDPRKKNISLLWQLSLTAFVLYLGLSRTGETPPANFDIFNMTEPIANMSPSSVKDRLAKLQQDFEELSMRVTRISVKLHDHVGEFEWFREAIGKENCTREAAGQSPSSSGCSSSMPDLEQPVREDAEPVGTDDPIFTTSLAPAPAVEEVTPPPPPSAPAAESQDPSPPSQESKALENMNEEELRQTLREERSKAANVNEQLSQEYNALSNEAALACHEADVREDDAAASPAQRQEASQRCDHVLQEMDHVRQYMKMERESSEGKVRQLETLLAKEEERRKRVALLQGAFEQAEGALEHVMKELSDFDEESAEKLRMLHRHTDRVQRAFLKCRDEGADRKACSRMEAQLREVEREETGAKQQKENHRRFLIQRLNARRQNLENIRSELRREMRG